MSVYSGFVTRQQESAYFSLTEQLVHTLQFTLLQCLQGTVVSASKVADELLPVYGQLARMETNKYLPPKISGCCRQLADFLGVSSPKVGSGELFNDSEWNYPPFSTTRSVRTGSQNSVSFTDTARSRRTKLSKSQIVQVQGRSNAGIRYETTIVEERRGRRPRRSYYAEMFTQKLSTQSPERPKASSKRNSGGGSPFKSGRHLMMPITALM
jgi:hypothetical protein